MFVRCLSCKHTFKSTRYKVERNKHNFCSISCYYKYKRVIPIGSKKCLYCGKVGIKKQNMFCNSKCAALFNNAKKRKERGEYNICLSCGKHIPLSKIYCGTGCYYNFEYKRKVKDWLAGRLLGSTPDGGVRDFVRRWLVENLGEKCQRCGWKEVHPITGKIPVEVEHVDGNWKNCNKNNLTLLCPNCHSLTPTFRALNRGKGRKQRRATRKKIKIGRTILKCSTCKNPVSNKSKSGLCLSCYNKIRNKGLVFSKKELLSVIKLSAEKGYCFVGRKYGLSGNGIKKAIKRLNKIYRRA